MALEAVARRALEYPYRVWGFGEGMALLGLLRAGWIDFVADLVRPSLDREPSPEDHLIPVEVLVELPLDVAPAVGRFVKAVAAQPHRPDLAGLNTMVWVDCLHTDVPGLLLAGEVDAARRVAELGCAQLQDESGLFSHGYDLATQTANGVHWGRGQGWALHGLLAVASPRVDGLLRALERHEQDGAWHTVVDDPASPIEYSVSALVAASLLDHRERRWKAMGERALRAALAALRPDGGLPVSSATPVGSYLDRKTGVYPWGQGALLLALQKVAR
jgi:unsaturated rhamnogalacturonyl hydrolase